MVSDNSSLPFPLPPHPTLSSGRRGISREGTRSAIEITTIHLKQDTASAPSLIIREGRPAQRSFSGVGVSYMVSPLPRSVFFCKKKNPVSDARASDTGQLERSIEFDATVRDNTLNGDYSTMNANPSVRAERDPGLPLKCASWQPKIPSNQRSLSRTLIGSCMATIA